MMMLLAKPLPALFTALLLLATGAKADAGREARLAIAIGTPGSESFTFGTELWAMGQITLLPEHGIAFASKEVTADEDRLALLQNREVDAALVYGRVPNAYDDDLRAIMSLWPKGISSEDADPVQFLIHKDVAADVVYLITRAMFENSGYFKNAHASLGFGQPGEAMTGLDIPLHAGAYRYYDENGFGLDQTIAADYWKAQQSPGEGEPSQKASIYSNFDDEALEQDEVDQIAAACRQALELGSLSVVLGDLNNTGCEVYQDELTDDPATAASVQTPPETASITAGHEASEGQGGPAIRWTPKSDDTDLSKKRPATRQPIM
ncbi:MAG: TAXI family TRAP transporter solute-binding subunit [Pseudomonadota bacterium]